MTTTTYMLYPLRKCWCGGYGVADCTYCEKALCIRHAHNPHLRSNETIQVGDFDYLGVNDPCVFGIAIKLSLIVNDQVIDSYKGRNVCADCHALNVRKAHANAVAEFMQNYILPQGKFDFAFFMLLLLPEQYKIGLVGSALAPHSLEIAINILHFTTEEIAQGWLKFAKNNNVPTDTLIEQDIQARSPRSSASQVQIPGWKIEFVATIEPIRDSRDSESFSIQPSFTGGTIDVKGAIKHIGFVYPDTACDPHGTNMLLYGVFKRMTQIMGIEWPWHDPDWEAGISPFSHRIF